MCRSVCFILIRPTYQARAKLLRSASRDRTREMIFRFTLSCHAIALASAEALYERRIKREANQFTVLHPFRLLPYFLILSRSFLLPTFLCVLSDEVSSFT